MRSLFLAVGCTIVFLASAIFWSAVIGPFGVGIFLILLPFIPTAWGLNEIRKRLKDSGLSTGRFFLLAYVPSLALSAVMLIIEYVKPITSSDMPVGAAWFIVSALDLGAGFVTFTFSSER